jgi:pyruvate dehydrogenase E2 component (dihydrolipoamide acetyltransferase)
LVVLLSPISAPRARRRRSGYFQRTVVLSSAGADPSGSRAESSGLKGEIRVEEPTRAQRSIARRSAETRATVPDLELSCDVEIGVSLRVAREQGYSLTAMLVRACALALRGHPRANAAYRDGRFELYRRVNVGVVMQSAGAFVTPTVLDADTKAPAELDEEIAGLAARAPTGSLTPPELAGATFTLSDLSGYGVDRWSTLVTPPQAAGLAAGRVRAAPVIRDGAVVPGEVIGLTLGCDHRILFGAQAGAFLDDICERLRTGRL